METKYVDMVPIWDRPIKYIFSQLGCWSGHVLFLSVQKTAFQNRTYIFLGEAHCLCAWSMWANAVSGSRGRQETQTWLMTGLISLNLRKWISNRHMPQSETNQCQDFAETNRRETLFISAGLGAMGTLA